MAQLQAAPSTGNRKARRLALKQARKTHGAVLTAVDHANQLIQQQEFENAVRLLEKTVNDFPKIPELWLLLGSSHESLGSLTPAYKCYKQTVILAPENDIGWLGLGRVLHALRRFEASEVALKRCLTIRPDRTEALQILAFVYYKLGNSINGLLVCERAIALKPEWDKVYYVKGHLHKSAGNFDEARKALLYAHELNPKEMIFLRALAEITDGSQLDDMLKKLNTLQSDGINNPYQRSQLLFSTAKICHTQKKYDEAFEHYRQANDLVRQAHPFGKDGLRAKTDELISIFYP